MDWDVILRAVGVLIGAVGTVYQLIVRDPRWRSTLKTDIEILNLLDAEDENRKYIQQNIDKTVRSRYPYEELTAEELEEVKREGLRVYSTSNLIIGIVFSVGFGYWTFSLLADGWNWWALLTGFFAFGGLGNIMLAFDKSMSR